MDLSHCKSQLPRLKEEESTLKVAAPISPSACEISAFAEQPTGHIDQRMSGGCATVKELWGREQSDSSPPCCCGPGSVHLVPLGRNGRWCQACLAAPLQTAVLLLLNCDGWTCSHCTQEFLQAHGGYTHVAVCGSVSLWCWKRHLGLWNRSSEGLLWA